jgi:ABC-type transporter Mla subunit MlaD
MPPSLPRPATVLGLTRAAVTGSASALAAVPARAFGVLDSVETLVRRIDAVVDRVEELIDRAERTIERAERTVEQTERTIERAERTVDQVDQVSGAATALVARSELIAGTADELLTAYERTLRRAAPMASRFVEQLSPEEVDAAIRLVDELPRLTGHLTADVLPILAKLDRVGPDIHDLLEVTRDLKLAVAGIPGLRMLRRRGEGRLADEADD